MTRQEFSIRPSRIEDFDRIQEIYARARKAMAASGNPRQWGDSWPPADLVREDILEARSFVCEVDGIAQGVFVYLYGADIEPTYRSIEEGDWLDDSPYGVIHRIASSGEVRGIGRFCLDWCFAQCGHMRIDTHPDNKAMRALLPKYGYAYCGIIHVVEDNDPRLAYERLK